MPNYCWNHVTIKGNTKQINKIYKKLRKYKDCNYFTAFGDFVLDKGKIDDDYEAIKDRYGDNFDTIYVYGTKWWDFEENGIMEKLSHVKDSVITVSGDSAWSPPVKLIKEICKYYKVSATMEYEEPGCDFGGETIIDEQGITEENDYEYGEWKYRQDHVDYIYEELRYNYEGNIDELDDDIKEGRFHFMNKERIQQLIDIVKEDAQELEKTE
tara:strand:- start:31 stop:666 length:636 start_codon:yes stop_codon:yes gene_type:complete